MCERFVSNAHHKLKNVRPGMGAATLLAPIDQSWLGIQATGLRQRNRLGWWSPPQALDDVFLRHGEHASSDVAISPGCLQWVVGPVGFVSVMPSCRIAISCASPGTHLSEELLEKFEGSGSVQLHKNTCRKKRWVRQAVVRRCQNNEFSMKEGPWTIK